MDTLQKLCEAMTSYTHAHDELLLEAATVISNLVAAGNRAIEAWDCTVLPVANDGMLQERMECLRAALVPNVQYKGCGADRRSIPLDAPVGREEVKW